MGNTKTMNIGYDELRRLSKEAKIAFRPMIFAEHIQKNNGLLPDELAASACWYYVRCAHINLQNVKDGAQYEGELDHVLLLNNLARSIANLYGLVNGPSDFMKYIADVRLEAMRCNLPWDVRVEDPLKAEFRNRTN